MIKPNYKLLLAIKKTGLTQRDYARILGVHESMFSRVLNKRVVLDDIQMAQYVRVLRRKVDELWPEGLSVTMAW